jgi:hypothetical protein
VADLHTSLDANPRRTHETIVRLLVQLRREAADCRPHPPPLQQVQGPPEPHLRQSVRTTLPQDHPEHPTASHQSHRVYEADAGPWASGDQRYVYDAEHWGETEGTADTTDEAAHLYEPRIKACQLVKPVSR